MNLNFHIGYLFKLNFIVKWYAQRGIINSAIDKLNVCSSQSKLYQ